MTDAERVDAPDLTIRTPDQRVRVFISSTLQELADERVAVRRAIESLRLTPVLFEAGARPYPPRALYRAYLAQSHVFVAIYWQSYGWVAPEESVSGLEDEYVLSDGLPRLIYVKAPSPERHPRLGELITRIQQDDQTSYRRFSDLTELERLVQDDLIVLLTERFEASTSHPSKAAETGRAAAPPPQPSTETIGREDDIQRVSDLLTGGARLVTLVGPGGVGKSRLALEVCQVLSPELAEGIAFVPLESVASAGDVMRTLADRVGALVEGGQSPLEAAADRLGDRRVVLLIDNFEQVADAARDLSELLERCPHAQALVTSRKPLHLRGEQEYLVAPLALPADPESLVLAGVPAATGDDVRLAPAIAMFLSRARDVAPGFALDDSNRSAVEALVRRLDGLPLAIELAAARMRLLDPAEMVRRLDSGAEVLGRSAADIPDRQRTLRTTLEWSHGLLTEEQRALFARLSVFPGGATLDALEEVCSDDPITDVLDPLAALVEGSLVLTGRDHGGPPRFSMLATVRDFAQHQLALRDEAGAVEERFLTWALARAAAGDPARSSRAHDEWDGLQLEYANLRHAAELLLERRDCSRFADLAASALPWMWPLGSAGQLVTWTERALTDGCADPAEPYGPRLLATVSMGRFLLGDFVGALDVVRDLDLETVAQTDPASACLLYLTRAVALPFRDDLQQAQHAGLRSLELADQVGYDLISAYSRSVLGSLATAHGDQAAAESYGRDALDIAQRMQLPQLIAHQHGVLATTAIMQGDGETCRRELGLARDALLEGPRLLELAHLLGHGVALALSEGRAADAARAGAASDAILDRLGLVRWPLYEAVRDSVDAQIRPVVGETYDQLVAEAARADPWEVFDAALRDRGVEAGGADPSGEPD